MIYQQGRHDWKVPISLFVDKIVKIFFTPNFTVKAPKICLKTKTQDNFGLQFFNYIRYNVILVINKVINNMMYIFQEKSHSFEFLDLKTQM